MNQIYDIGMLKAGTVGESQDNLLRLYDKNGYPVIGLFGRQDEFGNFLENGTAIQQTGEKLVELWNAEVCRQCKSGENMNQIDYDPEKFHVDAYGNLYPKDGVQQGVTLEEFENEEDTTEQS
jgi:hypothetical protein